MHPRTTVSSTRRDNFFPGHSVPHASVSNHRRPPSAYVVSRGGSLHDNSAYNIEHHTGGGVNNCFAQLAALLCCGAVAAAVCDSPRTGLRFFYGALVAVVAVVIISCLASLAMSVTGETLLSLLLIGVVGAGLALICQPRENHPRDLDENYYSQANNRL